MTALLKLIALLALPICSICWLLEPEIVPTVNETRSTATVLHPDESESTTSEVIKIESVLVHFGRQMSDELLVEEIAEVKTRRTNVWQIVGSGIAWGRAELR